MLEENFRLLINGQEEKKDYVFENSICLFSIKSFAERFGIDLRISQATKDIILAPIGRKYIISVNSDMAKSDSRTFKLDSPVRVINNEVYAPLDFLAKVSNLNFYTDNQAKTALLFKPVLTDRTIVLDPGHGGDDPGAIGPSGLEEKGVSLSICLALKKMLSLSGINTFCTRETDVFLPLKARVDFAYEKKADAFVSIHFNSYTNSNVSGTETYYYYSTRSKLLASLIHKEIRSQLNRKDRRVKEAGFFVLRRNRIPAIISEVAFISNPAEEALLRDSIFLQKAAEAFLRGIYAWYDIQE